MRHQIWGVCLVVAACSRPAAPPVATIQSPEDGWMGSAPVKVTLGATGTTIAAVADANPAGAHFHLFLNVDPSPEGAPIPAGNPAIIHLGGGQTEFTFDSLAPATYRVIVMLGDNSHVPLAGQRTDTVTFMVH